MRNELLYNEKLLLQRLAKGDADAFRTVYDKYYPLVFYYIRKKVGTPDKANDLTTDCFVKFLKTGKKDFDSLEGVKAYLLRSASNACINAHRDLQTERAHQKEVFYFLQNEQEDISEEDEYRAAMMALVLAEIDRLPKQCRRIFTMAYMEEKKNEEIAQELGLSEKTVRNQKHRALSMLRLALLDKKAGICIIFFLYQFLD